MSICSIHKIPEEGCRMCKAMSWDVLKTTKEEWEAKSQDAESEGLLTCPHCGFDGMFKKTCRQSDGGYKCPLCDKHFEETTEDDKNNKIMTEQEFEKWLCETVPCALFHVEKTDIDDMHKVKLDELILVREIASNPGVLKYKSLHWLCNHFIPIGYQREENNENI
jgi:DNA-directed RNA polymerase subunit RPC12/RpoP